LEQLGLSPANDGVFATFDNARFRGFSGAITEDEVAVLRRAEGVLSVREAAQVVPAASRSDATWGLQRISQAGRVSAAGTATGRGYTYTWNDTSALGAGVDIYVIDSGIYLEHDEFAGRARLGFNYFADQPGDVFGHGSHCAGTAAGETVGVATNANIIDVKAVADNGLGSSSGFFASLDWILQSHANRSTEPDFVASIVSMSLGFVSVLDNVDTAVTELAAAGIHVSIAAGNTFDDACTHSPSSAGGPGTDLLVVGASTINDTILWFSSTGPCVDVYAPGAEVVSAAPTGPSDYVSDSGTSMAAPHVAGLLAYFIGDQQALGKSPAAAKARVVDIANK
ncbi:peptidase S8/S53 domain-containing protein, partial [Macrophomina phaseolina]